MVVLVHLHWRRLAWVFATTPWTWQGPHKKAALCVAKTKIPCKTTLDWTVFCLWNSVPQICWDRHQGAENPMWMLVLHQPMRERKTHLIKSCLSCWNLAFNHYKQTKKCSFWGDTKNAYGMCDWWFFLNNYIFSLHSGLKLFRSCTNE